MNPESLKRISTWGKILGILMMIAGGLSALSGIFAFVIGAIPGLVTTFMGYLLFKTGKDAQEFLESQSEESIASLLDNYAKYLFLNGILLIITLVLVITMVLVLGASFFSLLGSL